MEDVRGSEYAIELNNLIIVHLTAGEPNQPQDSPFTLRSVQKVAWGYILELQAFGEDLGKIVAAFEHLELKIA